MIMQTQSVADKSNYCQACGAQALPAANFCAKCGARLNIVRAPISAGFVLGSLLASVMVWFSITTLSEELAGTRPTQEMPDADRAEQFHDTELEKLRDLAQKTPSDKDALRNLAEALYARISPDEQAPQKIIFEIIDSLGKVLSIDPKDQRALLDMADVSFSQQVFPKAENFYQRYLEINPNDLEVRAKHASTLTFLGDFKTAIDELKLVLQKDPKNFHANAYLAITYAQIGTKDEALKSGEKALQFAPNQEAKQRFQQFLESVKNVKASPGKAEALPASQSELSEHAQRVVDALKQSPVAGPKFSSAKEEGDELKLYFHDFPMQAMPPFAKEKFYTKLREAAQASALKQLIFLDSSTNQELDRLSLK